MKRHLPCLSLLAAALLAAPSAWAQTIKPGLWEIRNKMSSANPEMDQALAALLKQVASLPPEQRKVMEEMAARQGMSMPKVAADGGIAVTACVTPEMAARRQIPTGQPGDCKSNNQATPGGMKISFSCANPPSSGEGRLSFAGDTAFTMTMTVTSSARGKPEQVTVDSAGTWRGAACAAH